MNNKKTVSPCLPVPGAKSPFVKGVVVNLFKKGDKTVPGNYRGITLLSTVGKTFCKILNDRVGTMLEKEEKISEGQAGFRPNRSCVDHVYTLGKIIQGRKDARLTSTVSFWTYKRPMAPYGVTGCERSCGKLE